MGGAGRTVVPGGSDRLYLGSYGGPRGGWLFLMSEASL